MKLLGITEVSKMLNVSLNTLRNWDTSGYLPSVKTAGGHRRYDEVQVNNLINMAMAKSESYDLLTTYRQRILYEATSLFNANFFRANEILNFSKEELALVYRNHHFCNIPVNVDLWIKLLPKMLTPQICAVYPITGPSDLFFYKRYRNNKLVVEGEDIVFSRKEESTYAWNDLEKDRIFIEACEKLVSQIDFESVNDMHNNAHKILEVNETSSISDSVKKSLEILSHHVAEHRFIVVPPELSKYVKESSNYALHVSRHIHERKILIGTKSSLGFDNYVYSPFVWFNTNIEKEEVNMYSGKKLLREGSRGLVAIHLK